VAQHLGVVLLGVTPGGAAAEEFLLGGELLVNFDPAPEAKLGEI